MSIRVGAASSYIVTYKSVNLFSLNFITNHFRSQICCEDSRLHWRSLSWANIHSITLLILALFAAFDRHSVTLILVNSLLFSNLYIFNLFCLICNLSLYLSLCQLLASFTHWCPAHCNFQSNFVSVLSTCANSQSISQSVMYFHHLTLEWTFINTMEFFVFFCL